MKAQHTPGPWEVSDGSIIADEICISVIESDGGYEAEPDVRKANARLIAAAPDLLKALESLVACVERNENVPSWTGQWNTARAAIAKAKGEP